MKDIKSENIVSKINELQKQIKENPNDILLQDKLGNLLIENHQFLEAAKLFAKIANFYSNKVVHLKALTVCSKASYIESLNQEAIKKIEELYSLLGISRSK
jgi:uncharacterized protein HemY